MNYVETTKQILILLADLRNKTHLFDGNADEGAGRS